MRTLAFLALSVIPVAILVTTIQTFIAGIPSLASLIH